MKTAQAGLGHRYLWVGSESGPQHFYSNQFQNSVTWLYLGAREGGRYRPAERVVCRELAAGAFAF